MSRPSLHGLPRLYDPEPSPEDTEPDVASRIRSFFDSVLEEIELREREDEDDIDTRRFYRHDV